MKIASDLQPHVLAQELQRATVVSRFDNLSQPAVVAVKTGLLEPLKFWKRWTLPWAKPAIGVPHGVTDAVVLARNIRVMFGRVFFCPSRDYAVLGSSLSGADTGEYPPSDRSEMQIDCPLPSDGHYDVLMRVSVNGSIQVRIERFDARGAEVPTALSGA